MLTATQIEHIGDALGFQGPAIRGLSQQLIDHIYELEDRIELLEQENRKLKNERDNQEAGSTNVRADAFAMKIFPHMIAANVGQLIQRVNIVGVEGLEL